MEVVANSLAFMTTYLLVTWLVLFNEIIDSYLMYSDYSKIRYLIRIEKLMNYEVGYYNRFYGKQNFSRFVTSCYGQ